MSVSETNDGNVFYVWCWFWISSEKKKNCFCLFVNTRDSVHAILHFHLIVLSAERIYGPRWCYAIRSAIIYDELKQLWGKQMSVQDLVCRFFDSLQETWLDRTFIADGYNMPTECCQLWVFAELTTTSILLWIQFNNGILSTIDVFSP